ncbi:MAG: hypothetical protein ACJ71C_06965 [Nitrososphaeraceae archaeon]
MWYSTGRVPSGVPGYGVLGFRGHNRRSNTQTELRPSLSASFATYRTFSLVAESPVCGKSIPAFIICIRKSHSHLLLKPVGKECNWIRLAGFFLRLMA